MECAQSLTASRAQGSLLNKPHQGSQSWHPAPKYSGGEVAPMRATGLSTSDLETKDWGPPGCTSLPVCIPGSSAQGSKSLCCPKDGAAPNVRLASPPEHAPGPTWCREPLNPCLMGFMLLVPPLWDQQGQSGQEHLLEGDHELHLAAPTSTHPLGQGRPTPTTLASALGCATPSLQPKKMVKTWASLSSVLASGPPEPRSPWQPHTALCLSQEGSVGRSTRWPS